MTELTIPAGPDEVTSEWLTEALRGTGTIGRAGMASFEWERTGNWLERDPGHKMSLTSWQEVWSRGAAARQKSVSSGATMGLSWKTVCADTSSMSAKKTTASPCSGHSMFWW